MTIGHRVYTFVWNCTWNWITKSWMLFCFASPINYKKPNRFIIILTLLLLSWDWYWTISKTFYLQNQWIFIEILPSISWSRAKVYWGNCEFLPQLYRKMFIFEVGLVISIAWGISWLKQYLGKSGILSG